MTEKVTMKLLYEKLDETKKEERQLRHDQADKFQDVIMTMNEQNEKRFDKLEVLIKDSFDKADNKYSTKEDHKYNSEKINKISAEVSKLKESENKIMNLKNSIVGGLIVISFIWGTVGKDLLLKTLGL